jgi:hypothetical protein
MLVGSLVVATLKTDDHVTRFGTHSEGHAVTEEQQNTCKVGDSANRLQDYGCVRANPSHRSRFFGTFTRKNSMPSSTTPMRGMHRSNSS